MRNKGREEYFQKKADAIKLSAEIQAKQSGDMIKQQTAALIMAKKELVMMKRIFAWMVAREPHRCVTIPDSELMAIATGATVRMIRAKDKSETLLVLMETKPHGGETQITRTEEVVSGDQVPVRDLDPVAIPDEQPGAERTGDLPAVSEVREEDGRQGE